MYHHDDPDDDFRPLNPSVPESDDSMFPDYVLHPTQQQLESGWEQYQIDRGEFGSGGNNPYDPNYKTDLGLGNFRVILPNDADLISYRRKNFNKAKNLLDSSVSGVGY